MGFISKGQQFLVAPTVAIGGEMILAAIRIEGEDTVYLFLTIAVLRQETTRQKSVLHFNLGANNTKEPSLCVEKGLYPVVDGGTDDKHFRSLVQSLLNSLYPFGTKQMLIVFGKSLCYFMISALMGAWLVVVVPRMFHFPQLAAWQPLLTLMLPYTLACIFFGMVVSCIVRYRENVMLLMVFISVPLLFMTGVSWPQSNIPGFWQGASWVFPSTFGVRAYVRLNSMGASVGDVSTEILILWLHTFLYCWLACVVYGYQIYLARHDAFWRFVEMKKRRQK